MSDLRRPFDSDHPSDETLAGLVDGTLTVAERAELQAHLDGCERCRAEIGMADSAAKALRSLPQLEAPWGLGRAAVEEARKGGRPARTRRIAAVAGIAAAAALVVGISVAVLRGPQGSSPNEAAGANTSGATSSATGGSGKAALPKGPSPRFLQSTKNYSADDVAKLATRYSDAVNRSGPAVNPLASTVPAPTSKSGFAGISGTTGTSAPAGTTATSGTSGAVSTSGVTGASGGTSGPLSSGPTSADGRDFAADPVACIDTAAGYPKSVTPVQVIDARYEEKPALIGIFLRGPGADQPADLVVVWVASHQCELITYASHRVKP